MTSETTRYISEGEVIINGETYPIVRPSDQPGGIAYSVEHLNEPPYSDGAPPIASDPIYTWHLGGFKSRQGIAGTTSYGKNTDGRWAFRLLPSAKITSLTLTSSSTTPTNMFEALGYVFVCAGRYVYRINPSTNVVTLSKDFGASVSSVMGMRWEEDYALVCTDEATNSLYKCAAITPGGPDTWTQATGGVTAYRIASGIDRMYRVSRTGQVRNISTGLDPMSETNWADNVQIGETATLPTGLKAYERTLYIGKPEGLFGVGDDGFGLPLIKRMTREINNCFGMELFDPYLMVPHVRGLYRFLPGFIEAAGIEREILNESPVSGYWRGFASDGDWLYGALEVDTETYILAGHERRDGEPGFGPMIWDTWLWFDDTCKALWTSTLSTNVRLYFGYGVNVGFVELSNSPGAIKYATSGSRYSAVMRYDDWSSKDFPYIDLVGKNLSASKYWDTYVSVDGGAFSALDINGATMRLSSNGRTRFYLPVSTVGREIQYRWDYSNSDEDTPPELNFVEPFTRPQARRITIYKTYLMITPGGLLDHGRDHRGPAEMLSDLTTLLETAQSVIATGPWGVDQRIWIAALNVVSTIQEGDFDPTYIVETVIQHREAS